jgi:hypothetical protein
MNMKDVPKEPWARIRRIALRESAWLLGSIAAATAFCSIGNEYGYAPVPFFTLCFYVLIGVIRVLVRVTRAPR